MYHVGETFHRSFAHPRRCQALGIGRGGRNRLLVTNGARYSYGWKQKMTKLLSINRCRQSSTECVSDIRPVWCLHATRSLCSCAKSQSETGRSRPCTSPASSHSDDHCRRYLNTSDPVGSQLHLSAWHEQNHSSATGRHKCSHRQLPSKMADMSWRHRQCPSMSWTWYTIRTLKSQVNIK